MRRELSSSFTPLYRWILPALLSIAAGIVVWRLARIGMPGRPAPVDVAAAVAIAAALITVARILDRGKRVWIDGQQLIVSDYRHEIQIPFSAIRRIETTRFWKPDRVRIRFIQPTRFGDSIVFFTPGRWLDFSERNPVAEEIRRLVAVAERPQATA